MRIPHELELILDSLTESYPVAYDREERTIYAWKKRFNDDTECRIFLGEGRRVVVRAMPLHRGSNEFRRELIRVLGLGRTAFN